MTEETKKFTRDPDAKVAKLEAKLAKAKRAAREKALRDNSDAYQRLARARKACSALMEKRLLKPTDAQQCVAFISTLTKSLEEMATDKHEDG